MDNHDVSQGPEFDRDCFIRILFMQLEELEVILRLSPHCIVRFAGDLDHNRFLDLVRHLELSLGSLSLAKKYHGGLGSLLGDKIP